MQGFSFNPREVAVAAERLRPVVLRSPLLPYGDVGDNLIRLKAECLQPTGSFKIRGSTNSIASLDERSLAKGVYTASAGNFGQGVALAARRMGVPVRVYVPETAAAVKIQALESFGAKVIVKPQAQWWQIMLDRSADGETGQFLHPCADAAVIFGNATIGAEIVEDWPDVETIVVPFGGGGLVLGIALGAKAMKPDVRVVACESEAATPLRSAFDAGAPVKVPFDTGSFITGIGSAGVLDEMWPHLRRWVDDVVVVPVAQVEDAVRGLARHNHLVAEGAGAAALAGALALGPKGRNIAAVISGGNIDLHVLADILGRA